MRRSRISLGAVFPGGGFDVSNPRRLSEIGRVSNLALREVCPLLPVHVRGLLATLEASVLFFPMDQSARFPALDDYKAVVSAIFLRRTSNDANVPAAL